MKARKTGPISSQQSAFTLSELVVVIMLMGLLGLMLVPALGEPRTKSRGLRCLDNMRQVMNGGLMYTRDYHDLFRPNEYDAATLAGYVWAVGSVRGGMPDDPAPSGSSVFNSDFSSNSSTFLLLPYLGGDPSVLHCTADPRVGLYSGTNSVDYGKTIPATRSISMSLAVGTADAAYISGSGTRGIPNLPVPGVWLNGSHTGNAHNNPWRTYGSLSDMVIPGPASTWVFIEEDPYSIGGAPFPMSVAVAKWLDYPTTRHNMAGVVSFGDGHVELHKWQNAASLRITSRSAGLPPQPPPWDPDWNWLKARTSAWAQ